jgi:hypothetical protein
MVDPALVMHLRFCAWVVGFAVAGCVPTGSASQQDAGPSTPGEPKSPAAARSAPTALPSDVMKAPFEDSFDRAAAPPQAGASPVPPAGSDPGPDWIATAPNVWRIEAGRLCGEHARNHGIWLRRVLPVNARIEFDAVSDATDGDLKAEYWGDGRSYATGLSYTNATSYLTIFGGWHNKFHVLARIDEHANDRKQITVDPTSDDPREKPVFAGQIYHFKVERTDGKTVRWWVDNNELLSYPDPAPLVGPGHDHFAFNDWEVKVCFDNVRIAPLP